jgi:hypothetical protein
VPEEDGEDSLDLNEGKGVAHAGVHTPPEAKVGVGDLVLLPSGAVPVRVEGVRLGEDGLQPRGGAKRRQEGISN